MPRPRWRAAALVGSACALAGAALVWDLAAAPAPEPLPGTVQSTPESLAGVDRVEPAAASELVPVAGRDPGAPNDTLEEAAFVPLDLNATAESGDGDESAVTADAVPPAESPRSSADAGAPEQEPEQPPEPPPPPMACGLISCAPGDVCCNASCGLCVPEGETCDPTLCAGRARYPISTSCGQNTCSVGEVCCNPSCGTCVAEGESCDTTACTPRITVPVSMMCGQNTCSVGEVCCNPSCGTCAAEGATCDTTPCEPRIRYPL